MSSLFTNICFDVYSTAYDADTGMEVLGSVPTLRNVYGHLQETFVTQEGDVSSVRERDKSIRYRIVLTSTNTIEQYLILGAFLRVTKRPHPETNGWTTIANSTEQYIVRYINPINANGRELNIALERKDTD